ncbi:uncharacterized protein DS421_2g38520 [Arachis hypogaea]|nr:uncharacterized protein DS421_2g38520 [Arachis hypogaea]
MHFLCSGGEIDIKNNLQQDWEWLPKPWMLVLVEGVGVEIKSFLLMVMAPKSKRNLVTVNL